MMTDNTTLLDFFYENGTGLSGDEGWGNGSRGGQQPPPPPVPPPLGLPWPGKHDPPWETVRTHLKWVFLLHSYGFACSFLVLAFYAFFSVLNIRSLITSRPFMSTVNIFLCLLGASRALSMFIDPYRLKDVLPRAMGAVVWDLGLPSILSAFALVQLALLQLTQLRLGPAFLRRKSCLSLVISLHFTCTVAVDISLTLHSQIYVVKYVVETVFLVWGTLVCCTFLYAGYRAMEVLYNMPAVMLERDNDAQYKGIMQLSMLAPYNNLASSVAAALVPTLLAPKFAQDTRFSKDVQRPSSSKTEPVKSCITNSKGGKTISIEATTSDIEEAKGSGEGAERRGKKLSWGSDQRCAGKKKLKSGGSTKSRSGQEEEVEDATADTSLLPQSRVGMGPDLTLHTILNHIAYVNRASGGGSGAADALAAPVSAVSRRHQLDLVLRLTCANAALCLLLLLAHFAALYLPRVFIGEGVKTWLFYQTVCRSLELLMGCAMANMTKQPVSNRNRYNLRGKTTQSLFM